MPVECRSSTGSASRRTARIPQWASDTFTPKRTLSMPVSTGFPTKRLRNGIASPWIVPLKRDPMTRSSPLSRRSTKPRELVERVRVVRVAHHQVLAARGVEPREIRASVASPRLGHDDRAVCRRDLAGAVGRAVVDDDDLAGATRSADPLERLVDDLPDGFLLVQARDDHGDLRPHGNDDRRVGRASAPTGLQRVAVMPSVGGSIVEGSWALARDTVSVTMKCGLPFVSS